MRLHSQTLKVQMAGREFSTALDGLVKKYNLSRIELISLLSRQLTRASDHALGFDRHPVNPEKLTDEE